MILQTLLFPTPEICQAEELYYRQSGQEIYFDKLVTKLKKLRQ